MIKSAQVKTILAVCIMFFGFFNCNIYGDEAAGRELESDYGTAEEDTVNEEDAVSENSEEEIITEGIFEEIVLYSDSMFSGNGTEESPFKIQSQMDLINLSNTMAAGYNTAGKYFLLTGDIYTNGELYPIGTKENPFQGVFFAYESSPRNIYDLKIKGYEDYTALFAYTQSARIENVNLVDVSISGKDYTAALIGHGLRSEIINCRVSGEISGKYAVSGLVSVLEEGRIEESASLVSIKAETMAGGLVSSIIGNDSKILNSFFSGGIELVSSADDSAGGGLAAYLQKGVIEGCFSMAEIKSAPGIHQVGGFISKAEGGIIRNSYSAGTINSEYAAGFIYNVSGGTIENSYASVRISGNDFYSGFVSIGEEWTNFINCYFNKEINEGYVSPNTAEGITGLSTFEMTAEASENMTGFEKNVWYFDENSGNSRFYPQLFVFYSGKNNAYSLKSTEAGVFYSVKFMIPFDMSTEEAHLVNQLVLPGESCVPPELKGEDAERHMGWSLDDGGEIKYEKGIIININENLVLYPVFSERVTFKVIYTSAGAETGRVPEDSTIYSLGDSVLIKDNEGNLTKSGYKFDGWKDQNGRTYNPGDYGVISASLKLDPIWKEVQVSSGGTSHSSSVSNYYGSYDLPSYTDSFMKFAEIFKAIGEIYTQQPDNKISVDTEIYFKESQGLFEDYVEMLFKFSIELPLEALN